LILFHKIKKGFSSKEHPDFNMTVRLETWQQNAVRSKLPTVTMKICSKPR